MVGPNLNMHTGTNNPDNYYYLSDSFFYFQKSYLLFPDKYVVYETQRLFVAVLKKKKLQVR